MNVVYYSSDSFSEICGVSIQSLLENNVDIESICIYVIEDRISEKNKTRLRHIAESFSRELVFIKMPSQEEVYPGVSIDLGRTYARMALGEILPQSVDRVLSLDSDTLVLDSLEEMYSVQFSDDEYVAGVLDCVGAAIQNDVLKAPFDLQYCNAGMFLIDLKKWRAAHVGDELLSLLLEKNRSKEIMYFLEQDLMNLVFYRHLKLLNPRYNMLTSIYYFDYDEIMRMKRPVSYYSPQVIASAKAHPAIVHATTCFYVKRRMWVQNSDHPYRSWYEDYRQKTEWADDAEMGDQRSFSKRLYSGFWHVISRKAAVNLASFMINRIRPTFAAVTTRASIATVASQS